jgi:hypothetical protein
MSLNIDSRSVNLIGGGASSSVSEGGALALRLTEGAFRVLPDRVPAPQGEITTAPGDCRRP